MLYSVENEFLNFQEGTVMANNFFRFDLSRIPFYYVSGLFLGTREWERKELIQPGNYGILLVLGGLVYLAVNHHFFTVYKNEFLVVPPFQQAKGFRKIPRGTQYIWIHFFPRTEAKVENQYQQPAKREAVFPQHGQLYNVQKVISSAIDLINAGQDKNSYIADLATAQFLLILSGDYAALVDSHQENNSHLNIAESVYKYLTIHFLEIEHIKDLESIIRFSVPYMNKQFKGKYGMSLYQFLIDLRLRYAKRLLALGNDPVYAVASQSHFPDSKNFSRLFKRKVGISPLQYRKQKSNYRISTPTYDPVIPVSDKIMNQLIAEGLKWPRKQH